MLLGFAALVKVASPIGDVISAGSNFKLDTRTRVKWTRRRVLQTPAYLTYVLVISPSRHTDIVIQLISVKCNTPWQ